MYTPQYALRFLGLIKKPRIMLRAGLGLLSLGAANCSRLTPSGGRTEELGNVSFAMDHQSLELLSSSTATKLRLRVFAVVGEQTTTQEGADALFDITKDQDTFTLGAVQLGMKEFQAQVLDAAGTDLGDGKERQLIKSGAQTLPPLTIQLRAPAKQHRDVPISFAVNVAAPGQAASYAVDIKPILTDHCVSCHSGGSPAAGVDLSAFEFKQAKTPLSQADLVKAMIADMTDPKYPMPPANTKDQMTAAQVATFQSWLDGGLLKAPAAADTAALANTIKVTWKGKTAGDTATLTLTRGTDPAAPFNGICANMTVQESYDFDISVLATDGSTSYHSTIAAFVVDDKNTIGGTLNIPVAAPVVSIPIVITH